MKLLSDILCGIFLMTLTSQVFSTTFADKPEKKIISESPEFLREVGLEVESEIVANGSERKMLVTFKSSQVSGFNENGIEVLLLGADGQLLLAVENPFTNSMHESRYIVSFGNSLMVSVVKNIQENSTYHKVIFENK